MKFFYLNQKNKSQLVKISILLCLLAATLHTKIFANDMAGKTILAKGLVEAIDQTSKEKRKLKRRSKIFNVDHIITGDKSKAQFSMSDGGLITLKANTEVLIDNYKFDTKSNKGSATIELVNGGLRSISGLIKKSGGDYQVKTPVGSIGIRGTHFAVEVVDENVFFAVYSGDIDVQLSSTQTLSLGLSEDFAFASINSEGEVTPMTLAPIEISLGYADNNVTSSTSNDTADRDSGDTVNNSVSELSSIVNNENSNFDDLNVYNESELQGVSSSPIAELLSMRTGTLSYQNLVQSTVNSSVGQVSDLTMTMEVDFDNASVPGGSLSFSDNQGEWFAAYSGLINIDQIDLGVNFASHGNNKAEGDISAAFSNGLDEITGGFSLKETTSPSVTANGSFKIQP
jgi:hypothetical protein